MRAEWNTRRHGPDEAPVRGGALIHRLRARFAPRRPAALRPGQVVPRRAAAALGVQLLLAARRQAALGATATLIAAERHGLRRDGRPGARAFLEGVARRARASTPAHVMPAYEDPWHFIGAGTQAAREPRPATQSARRSDGARAARARLRAGLGKPVGYVLPVQRWNADGRRRARWSSEPWMHALGQAVPRARRFAAGFRLPLPSLPYCRRSTIRTSCRADPFAEHGAAAATRIRERQPFLHGERARRATAGPQAAARRRRARHARTALAVEPRDGRLCVFMPPVAELEDYLDLLAAVEDTSAELELPIHLEGYEPPRDPRLNVIKVTPDPGVIEVNVQPAGELGRDARDHRRPLRGRALRRGS